MKRLKSAHLHLMWVMTLYSSLYMNKVNIVKGRLILGIQTVCFYIKQYVLILNNMATDSSTLAWKIPWMDAIVHGVTKSWTWLSDFTFTFHFHALEKEMAAHSSVLAWRISRTGEPGGLPSTGSHWVGHDWSDWAEQQQHWSYCCILKIDNHIHSCKINCRVWILTKHI